MAEREIVEGWRCLEGPNGYVRVRPPGDAFWVTRTSKRSRGLLIEADADADGIARPFLPLEVLAEALRLSGYDVKKREGT